MPGLGFTVRWDQGVRRTNGAGDAGRNSEGPRRPRVGARVLSPSRAGINGRLMKDDLTTSLLCLGASLCEALPTIGRSHSAHHHHRRHRGSRLCQFGWRRQWVWRFWGWQRHSQEPLRQRLRWLRGWQGPLQLEQSGAAPEREIRLGRRSGRPSSRVARSTRPASCVARRGGRPPAQAPATAPVAR
jgi:hypothetical protein